MHEGSKVVIIGGGVIGAATALFLRNKGWSVTLLEKDRFGSGASHGNCGLIVPDHVLPLNSIGNMIKGLKWMFKQDAPLYIKPQADPSLLKWLAKFVLHCRQDKITLAAKGCSAMMKGAIDLYTDFINENRLDCEWNPCGALHLYTSEKEFNAYRCVDRQVRQFGAGAIPLDSKTLCDLEPAVRSDLAGAWFSRNTALLRPDTLMAEFRRLLLMKGVDIIENVPMTGIRKDNGRAVAAVAPQGELEAGQFVIATGAWTPLLGKVLGCRIPIQPGKGYSTTFREAPGGPSIPCFFEKERVVATPWPSGLRLGGSMEFSGYDTVLNRHRIDVLDRAARRYLIKAETGDLQEEWCGWRPMTYDGLPIIDQLPGLKNVFVAAGHNMLGMTMAPRTGRLVAEMVSRETPHIDPYPYRINRF